MKGEVPPSAVPVPPTAFVSSRTVPYVVRVGGEYFRGLIAVDGFVSVGPVVAIESPSIKIFSVNKYRYADVARATTSLFDSLPIKIPENLITGASVLVFATSRDSTYIRAANLKVIVNGEIVRFEQKPQVAWDVEHRFSFVALASA
jgi:hypothetical protein